MFEHMQISITISLTKDNHDYTEHQLLDDLPELESLLFLARCFADKFQFSLRIDSSDCIFVDCERVEYNKERLYTRRMAFGCYDYDTVLFDECNHFNHSELGS